MPDHTAPTSADQPGLQTDKWRFEKAARERELALKEGELHQCARTA